MKSSWVSLCCAALVVAVHATHTHYYSSRHCDCNGRSQYCLRDDGGLYCVDCQGHTEGRHCERCKDGFYLQGAELSCTACRCHPAGSVGDRCDSRGRCSCRGGVSGDKCDRCGDETIGAAGCSQSRRAREDSGSQTCFCYGHSSRCSEQSGYSAHSITSTFSDGADGWTVATLEGVTPDNVHFRWSPSHQDLEVISKNSLPVYLYAPAPYLGSQQLSYGQNLSFWLRLDRGVRQPSDEDLVLEGGGQRVSASLGDLRSIVPCGQKIHYSFRLDERPGSSWRPQLSSDQFHRILQNLTAIKIRATFGQNGRGYLDNVQLVSARRGDGVPARWVQTCSCPPGYEGDFCERCSAGFRRRSPADGAFSSCERCSCRGGSCDPQTGDCYSADETPGDLLCSEGFYRDPWKPRTCVKCPCPDGVSCSLAAGSPRCDRCPTGAAGPRCDVCQEGFHGDPAGGGACSPCRCNGHIDAGVAGSCDRRSGECLKCLNNTRGRSCEVCQPTFYHRHAGDACKPCDCDLQGSESGQCDDSGRCRCRTGFEGLRCQRSDCPDCFSPVKTKVEVLAAKLKDLETLMSQTDGGLKPAGGDTETLLRAAEELLDDLQYDTELLAGLEKKLQGRLSSISRSQLTEGQNVQDVADAVADIRRRQKTYETTAGEVQNLTRDMKRKLDKAAADLRSAEFPLSDGESLSSNVFDLLAPTATRLSNQHQDTAADVERSADAALRDSEKSLALVRTLMNKEDKLKELIGDLKTTYDKTSAQVKGLENQAARLSDDARDESKMADGMLKDIANMERTVPSSLKQVDALVSRLDDVKAAVDEDVSDVKALKDVVLRDKATAEDLLAKGKTAQQEVNKLLDRVNVAKSDTEDVLRRINGSSNQLDDTLNALRGFDQQIDDSKDLADAAIKRLPAISGTIQQAVGDNSQTFAVLGGVSRDYDDAEETIGVLNGLVKNLEGTVGSLPSHGALLTDATKLNRDSDDLKTQAASAAADLASELDAGRKLEADAQQAAEGAAAAFNNARETRNAVGKTLQDIGRLLANINQPGVVDEEQLKELEDLLSSAQRDVEDNLRPRLRDMQDQEAAQRRRLNVINLDTDTILGDIANLEDILRAVPSGCFNSPPIEEA